MSASGASTLIQCFFPLAGRLDKACRFCYVRRPLCSRCQLQITVRDNNIDQALRVLKKKMQREGLFREMKRRSAYEKPSERRVREKAAAIRRYRKMQRKKLQRDGLFSR